jgi:hypothetical protein
VEGSGDDCCPTTFVEHRVDLHAARALRSSPLSLTRCYNLLNAQESWLAFYSTFYPSLPFGHLPHSRYSGDSSAGRVGFGPVPPPQGCACARALAPRSLRRAPRALARQARVPVRARVRRCRAAYNESKHCNQTGRRRYPSTGQLLRSVTSVDAGGASRRDVAGVDRDHDLLVSEDAFSSLKTIKGFVLSEPKDFRY